MEDAVPGIEGPDVRRFEHDQVGVTINAADFLFLAGSVERSSSTTASSSRGPRLGPPGTSSGPGTNRSWTSLAARKRRATD